MMIFRMKTIFFDDEKVGYCYQRPESHLDFQFFALRIPLISNTLYSLLMRHVKKRLFLYLITALIFLTTGCAAKEGYVITNVNIIPMNEETILENRNLVVKNGKIVAITAPEEIPGNLRVIDGKGKYVIPGLMDMLTYIGTQFEMHLYLANGITTIRCIAGSEKLLEVREKKKQGEIIGPRLYVCSPIITGPQTQLEYFNKTVLSTYEVEMLLKQYKKAGYDFVSTYLDITADVYRKIMVVSKDIDLPLTGFIPFTIPMDEIIAGKPASLVYTYRFLGDKHLINKAIQNNIWNCPGFNFLYNHGGFTTISQLKGIEYVPQSILSFWEKQNFNSIGNINIAKENFRLYKEQGGKILAGSGAFTTYTIPGFSLHDELEHFVQNEMTPFEALQTATWNPAEFLGIQDKYGSIEIGKIADLVILEKNPLENIRNTETVFGVMQGEKWYNRLLLDAYLYDISVMIERIDNEGLPYEYEWD